MVAHILVPWKQTERLDGNIGVGIVEEEGKIGIEVVIIGRRCFFAKGFASLFVIQAVEAAGCQNLIDTQDVAILLSVVKLVDIAVKVADDDGAVVFEVGRVFVKDFLGYLRIGLLARYLLSLCRPNGEDENVANDEGNGVEVIGIVPVGDVA